jgi:hypothetical protein
MAALSLPTIPRKEGPPLAGVVPGVWVARRSYVKEHAMEEPFQRGELVTLTDATSTSQPVGRIVAVTAEGDRAEVAWHQYPGHDGDVTVEHTDRLRRVHESELNPE